MKPQIEANIKLINRQLRTVNKYINKTQDATQKQILLDYIKQLCDKKLSLQAKNDGDI